MRVIIIGGGASGMFLACHLKSQNLSVTLIEQNEKLGKKLYITGKGRCNLTNDCDEQEFLNNVVTNPKFMLSSIYSCPPKTVMDFFENNGLMLKVERGNRVFPVSDKSSDVIKTLSKTMEKHGVTVKLNEKVEDLIVENNAVIGVKTNLNKYFADKVIVATGGITYPSTGATGSGYKFAKNLNHEIINPTPSLVGLNLVGEDFKPLQGVSLKNVNLLAVYNNKTIFSEQGEMLFTHYGVSGPLVISLSAYLKNKNLKDVKLYIDLKPALTFDALDKRILRDFEECKNKEIKSSLNALLPKALIPLVIKRSGIKEYIKVNSISKEQRFSLNKTLKGLEFSVLSLRDVNEAIITSGGVSVKNVNPKTMESKITKNLYFIGEVLDVDALTGGFNLQIAFSTAYICAESILNNL